MFHCHHSTVPVHPYAVWPYMRDNAKGTTPHAQEVLDDIFRDYLPPSPKHLKTLGRQRPLVLIARPPAPPTRNVQHHNAAYAMGQKTRRLLALNASGVKLNQPPRVLPPVAFDFTKAATVPKSDAVGSYDDYQQQAEKLKREFDAAVADAKAKRHA